MPKEMREYENQEMESNESPVPQVDEEHTVEGIQNEQAPAMEESAAPTVPAQTSARRRQAMQHVARRSSVVAIGAQLQAETEAEKNQNALLDLVESMKSRRVLSGTVQGVERPENSPSRSMAVLYHGDFKVIIPAEEMVDPPEDLHGLPKSEVLFSMVNRRMGAEVDYVVKGVDQESGLAAASRLEAMAIKRREYYTGTGRDGNNLLYEGVCAEGRVVAVVRAGAFVELFGVETFIPLRELSYQRMLDATAVYQPGQRVVVKLLEIHRTDRDHIQVAASVKQASANPYEKALRRYSVGNRYVGTVSMVHHRRLCGLGRRCGLPVQLSSPRQAAPGCPGDRSHSGHQSRNKPYLGRDHPCLHAPLRRTFVHFFGKSLWNRFPGTGFVQSNKFLHLPCFLAGNVVVL